VGGLAVGGGAIGVLAVGGGAAGLVAQGGAAIGWYARGGGAIGAHVVNFAGASSQAARDMFESLKWFFGAWPPNLVAQLQPIGWIGLAMLVTSILIAIPALWKWRGEDDSTDA
jgi:hypothetical protein